jgi:hypothetical protein
MGRNGAHLYALVISDTCTLFVCHQQISEDNEISLPPEELSTLEHERFAKLSEPAK